MIKLSAYFADASPTRTAISTFRQQLALEGDCRHRHMGAPQNGDAAKGERDRGADRNNIKRSVSSHCVVETASRTTRQRSGAKAAAATRTATTSSVKTGRPPSAPSIGSSRPGSTQMRMTGANGGAESAKEGFLTDDLRKLTLNDLASPPRATTPSSTGREMRKRISSAAQLGQRHRHSVSHEKGSHDNLVLTHRRHSMQDLGPKLHKSTSLCGKAWTSTQRPFSASCIRSCKKESGPSVKSLKDIARMIGKDEDMQVQNEIL